MAYIAVALACFVAAQVLLVAGGARPIGALQAPATLAAVHLLTIGWLTLLMFAALRQFVPVITVGRPKGDRAALVALAAVAAGLVLMVAGFLRLGRGDAVPWLPIGGGAVIVGVALLAAIVAASLLEARPLPFAGRFVAAGLGGLAFTVSLGLTMALALSRPRLLGPAVGPVLTRGLELHAGIGVLGWFTLTAIGVGYKLFAMFTLAPEERGPLGHVVFALTAGGMGLVALTGLADLFLAPHAPALRRTVGAAAWWVVIAGFAAYLIDMTRLYRQRRRRTLELNASFGRAALVALGAGLALLTAGAVFGFLRAEAGAIAYLLLFGWLSGLALTQLYKIVPFLTWIERFGSSLGKGPVPRVQDLVDERAARPWFALYFAAVAVGTVAALMGAGWLWTGASAGTLAGTLAITVELVRARYRLPRPAGTPPPARGTAQESRTPHEPPNPPEPRATRDPHNAHEPRTAHDRRPTP